MKCIRLTWTSWAQLREDDEWDDGYGKISVIDLTLLPCGKLPGMSTLDQFSHRIWSVSRVISRIILRKLTGGIPYH